MERGRGEARELAWGKKFAEDGALVQSRGYENCHVNRTDQVV